MLEEAWMRSSISKVGNGVEGLSVEFFDGAVLVTSRNVHGVDATHVLALE